MCFCVCVSLLQDDFHSTNGYLYAYEGQVVYDPAAETTPTDLTQQVNSGYLMISFKFLHNNNLFISINGGTYYCAVNIDKDNAVNLQQFTSQYKQLKRHPENLNIFTQLPADAERGETDNLRLAVGGTGPADSFMGEIAEVWHCNDQCIYIYCLFPCCIVPSLIYIS